MFTFYKRTEYVYYSELCKWDGVVVLGDIQGNECKIPFELLKEVEKKFGLSGKKE